MNYAQKKLIGSISLAHKLYSYGIIGKCIAKLIKLRNRVLFSCDIGITAIISPDYVFHHSGLGVVIGNDVKIGKKCEIFSNVCIGAKKNNINIGNPTIGNNVMIGTGAILIGDIDIGDNVIIAAGSIVINSFPQNVMIAGNPAQIKKHI